MHLSLRIMELIYTCNRCLRERKMYPSSKIGVETAQKLYLMLQTLNLTCLQNSNPILETSKSMTLLHLRQRVLCSTSILIANSLPSLAFKQPINLTNRSTLSCQSKIHQCLIKISSCKGAMNKISNLAMISLLIRAGTKVCSIIQAQNSTTKMPRLQDILDSQLKTFIRVLKEEALRSLHLGKIEI